MRKLKLCLIVPVIMAAMLVPAVSGSSTRPMSRAQRNVHVIKETAKQVGVELAVCLAIARGETVDFDDSALNDNRRGRGSDDIRQSHGLYQLTYETGKTFGIKKKADLYEVHKNARAGIKYIKYLLDKYPQASLSTIAEMYNLGETRFAAGATAHAYAERFMKYYRLYSQGPQQSGV